MPRFEPLQELRSDAAASGARWLNLKTGDRAEIDGVAVLVRHPDPADWERQRVRNDDSIVLELRWRDVSVWLTGDIGRAVVRHLGADPPHTEQHRRGLPVRGQQQRDARARAGAQLVA